MVPTFNGPIYEGIFTNICSFFRSPNFPIMVFLTQVTWFRNLSPVAFQAFPSVYALKRAHIRAINVCCAKVSQTGSYYLQIWPLSFAPDLKRLPDLCTGANTPLHTQVSVLLVPYKLNVSSYYFPF